jgi:AcrR family transcriptional regulator
MSRPERRDQFIEAAIQVIRRKGAGVSMAEIAAEAGVSKPILYRHVGDRAGLYLAMADRFVSESLAAHQGPPLTGRPLTEKTIDAFLAFVEREPELFRFLRDGSGDAGEGGASDFVCSVGTQVARSFEEFGAPAESASVLGQAMAGAVGAAASWWIDHRTVSRQRMTEHLSGLLWEGLNASVAGWGPIDESVVVSTGRIDTPAHREV